MVDALGAGAGTFARVTGSFFLGLALGAWFASRWQPGQPWRGLALAELGVGLWSLLVLFVSREALDSILSYPLPFGLLDWIWPLVCILPPAAAMGVVLPWLFGQTGPSSARAVWLYAANTAGAILGVGAILIWALPTLSLQGAVMFAAGLNLAVAGLAVVLPFLSSGNLARSPEDEDKAIDPATCLLAFASGFLLLGQEVVWQHQLAQVTINSLFSSGLLISVVLFFLALAASLTPVVVRMVGSVKRALSVALLAAGLLVAVQPFLLVYLRGGLNPLPYSLDSLEYFFAVFRVAGMSFGPSLLVAGLIFPLLILVVEGRGRAMGRLLAWNGLGGLAGAEMANWVIVPAFGLWQSVCLLALGYLALYARQGRPLLTVAAAVAVCGAALFAGNLIQVRVPKADRLVAVGTGPEGVVAVTRRSEKDWSMLFNNTYTLGGSKAQYHQERQAHLPILLHGDARRVGLIGIATGSTLAGAALHPEVESIEAFELSPLVLNYARQHFRPFNRDALDDPRVRSLVMDGRRALLHQDQSYDVLIGDLFLPWRTGEGRLFALEHFQNCRKALRPGGLFAQWLPLYQLTRPQFEAIARTFLEVFPDASLIRGDFYAKMPIVALVGGRSFEALDRQSLAEATTVLREFTVDPSVRSAEAVELFLLGPLAGQVPDGPINTLGNAWLEWNAADNILGEKEPWFVGEPWLEFATGFASGQAKVLIFGDQEIRRHPSSAGRIRAEMKALFPEEVLLDEGADWTLWPSAARPY